MREKERESVSDRERVLSLKGEGGRGKHSIYIMSAFLSTFVSFVEG